MRDLQKMDESLYVGERQPALSPLVGSGHILPIFIMFSLNIIFNKLMTFYFTKIALSNPEPRPVFIHHDKLIATLTQDGD